MTKHQTPLANQLISLQDDLSTVRLHCYASLFKRIAASSDEGGFFERVRSARKAILPFSLNEEKQREVEIAIRNINRFWDTLAKSLEEKGLHERDLVKHLANFLRHHGHNQETASTALASAMTALESWQKALQKKPEQDLLLSPTPTAHQAPTRAQEPPPARPQPATPPVSTIPEASEPAAPAQSLGVKIKPQFRPDDQKKRLLEKTAINLLHAIEKNEETTGDTTGIRQLGNHLNNDINTIIASLLEQAKVAYQKKRSKEIEFGFTLRKDGQWEDSRGREVSQREVIETTCFPKDVCEGTSFLLGLIKACEQVEAGEFKAASTSLRLTMGFAIDDETLEEANAPEIGKETSGHMVEIDEDGSNAPEKVPGSFSGKRFDDSKDGKETAVAVVASLDDDPITAVEEIGGEKNPPPLKAVEETAEFALGDSHFGSLPPDLNPLPSEAVEETAKFSPEKNDIDDSFACFIPPDLSVPDTDESPSPKTSLLFNPGEDLDCLPPHEPLKTPTVLSPSDADLIVPLLTEKPDKKGGK